MLETILIIFGLWFLIDALFTVGWCRYWDKRRDRSPTPGRKRLP